MGAKKHLIRKLEWIEESEMLFVNDPGDSPKIFDPAAVTTGTRS